MKFIFQSLIISLFAMQTNAQQLSTSVTRSYAFRLRPNQDLKKELQRFIDEKQIAAACVFTCVGSLTSVNIRYANQEAETSLTGHFEIVSLVGNIDFQNQSEESEKGSSHIHIAVSDELGATVGGHLSTGNIVYTTITCSIHLNVIDKTASIDFHTSRAFSTGL
jgi:predicted DNA-binding protein with PD1-like motif